MALFFVMKTILKYAQSRNKISTDPHQSPHTDALTNTVEENKMILSKQQQKDPSFNLDNVKQRFIYVRAVPDNKISK